MNKNNFHLTNFNNYNKNYNNNNFNLKMKNLLINKMMRNIIMNNINNKMLITHSQILQCSPKSPQMIYKIQTR